MEFRTKMMPKVQWRFWWALPHKKQQDNNPTSFEFQIHQNLHTTQKKTQN